GLKAGHCRNSLAKKPARSYDELLERCTKYMNMEETEADFQAHDRARGKKQEEKHKLDDRKSGGKDYRGDDRGRLGFKYEHYTPLTSPRGQVYEMLERRGETKMFGKPQPLPKRSGKAPVKGDPYCRYHRDYGHWTNHCKELKDEIERLIRAGHLKEFVVQDRGKKDDTEGVDRKRRPEEQGERALKRGVIHMIAGGPTDGDSNAARKANLRADWESVAEVQIVQPIPDLTFGARDSQGVLTPHNDALVVTAEIANYDVERILVDTGSSADIMFYECFRKMDLGMEITPITTSLFGFSGAEVVPLGEVQLTMALGTPPLRKVKAVRFVVVKADSAYNVILGRPSLNSFQVAVSTYCMKMKFPVGDLVGEVTGDQRLARSCYQTVLEAGHKRKSMETASGKVKDESSSRGKEARTEVIPQDELMEIALVEGECEKVTKIGAALQEPIRTQLVTLLREYVDIFAFTPEDLVGIDREVAEHKLNIDPKIRPVKQKRRHFGAELDVVIGKEVEKMIQAGHVKPIQFPEWLSNQVMVKKAENKWRMCMDFRDLNKACPKDHYPLPRIDQLVDSTAGCELLSMMDASQGYHQIPLAVEDQKRVSFVTSKGTYCYIVMPFGLRNAGATYQRMVDKMFSGQLGRNMEVYVDDMLVKSHQEGDHVGDLRETFRTLRRYKMKLNPAKCKFGVRSGKFLGYMVTERGIEVNPEKVRAVLDMQPPRTIKEVQILTGRLAGLSRFIARAAERSFPFFRALRKGARFQWSAQAQEAFDKLKEFLAALPLLTKPDPMDVLILYLSVGEVAISSVLLKEDGGGQQPIYYVSKLLQGAEMKYAEVEKEALALIITARKLRPYFLSHMIVVRTNFPLSETLGRPSASGRMVKWAVELGEYNVSFEMRRAIKAQALADFIQEGTMDEKP
ncbi:Unknown protein, partial [Striga hermonthica]